jgi:hypothetical protein
VSADTRLPEEVVDEVTIQAVADAVAAGRDGIALPVELTEDPAAPESATAETPTEAMVVRIRRMTVGERIKLALRGNKEARIVLLRESNKVIVRLVLENPRITEEEVVTITHNRTAEEDTLRLIADRRDWTQVYQIRSGLVTNPRTPVAIALRFLPTLDDRDIRRIAKSKNVPDAVSGAARRAVAARQMRTR